MLPWQRAQQWHDQSGSVCSFEALLAEFLHAGYLWSSPTEFILARQARWEEGELYLGAVEALEVNCWFVHLAAGQQPFRRFLDLAPMPLPFVAWQRRGSPRYHVHTWEQLKRRTKEN